MKRILRDPQVEERTGLNRLLRWRLIRDGKFPQPIHLGPRARGWLEDEIDKWVEARVKDRTKSTG